MVLRPLNHHFQSNVQLTGTVLDEPRKSVLMEE